MSVFLTINKLGFLQIGMAGEGFCLPLCNFYLYGPNDLKFSIWMVFGNISREQGKNIKKLPRSCSKRGYLHFEHSLHQNKAFTRNAIKSVADVTLRFCLYL